MTACHCVALINKRAAAALFADLRDNRASRRMQLCLATPCRMRVREVACVATFIETSQFSSPIFPRASACVRATRNSSSRSSSTCCCACTSESTASNSVAASARALQRPKRFVKQRSRQRDATAAARTSATPRAMWLASCPCSCARCCPAKRARAIWRSAVRLSARRLASASEAAAAWAAADARAFSSSSVRSR